MEKSKPQYRTQRSGWHPPSRNANTHNAVHRICLILLFVLGSLSHAREKPSRIPVSFYCFAYADGLQEVYVRTGADSYSEIQLSTANIIGPMEMILSDGAVTLHRKDKDAEGREIHPLVGSAKIGRAGKPLLVLFPAAKNDKLPYRTLTLDRSNANFPLGSYQFINVSPHPMRGRVGKTLLHSKPGSVTNLRPEGAPGDVVAVVFEHHDGKLWRPMTQTRWAIRSDRRTLLCAYLDPRDRRVKMRAIPERLVPPKQRDQG